MSMQQPTIISEIMESLRLYCVHLSLLAIENNGAVTVNDQSSRNQPKNSDDKNEDNRRNHILLKISNIEIRILINMIIKKKNKKSNNKLIFISNKITQR